MIILIVTAIVEAILLVATLWSTRRKPVRARIWSGRGRDDLPYAL